MHTPYKSLTRLMLMSASRLRNMCRRMPWMTVEFRQTFVNAELGRTYQSVKCRCPAATHCTGNCHRSKRREQRHALAPNFHEAARSESLGLRTPGTAGKAGFVRLSRGIHPVAAVRYSGDRKGKGGPQVRRPLCA